MTAPRAGTPPADALDRGRVRADFPILAQRVHGKPLVYLDSAATTQKPRVVIDAVNRFYLTECSNIHRGLHALSARATADFEQARDTVRSFIGARDRREIVFTHGTTESINLVARSFGERWVGPGDEVLVSEMEHHSNIVPWQLLCGRTGARLVVAPVGDSGELDLDELGKRLGPRTRLVAITHVSNVLGTENPVRRIVELAHANGTRVLIDGAQAVAHERIDVQQLDCDFYAFSGHKLYGPTGIGVLYGKAELLEEMPPCFGGGDMIRTVSFAGTTYNDLPYKFEAGTPHIAGAIGLGAAIGYLAGLGLERVRASEDQLRAQAARVLQALPRVRCLGPATGVGPVLSFTVLGVHPHDIGTALDLEGVAVRAGHHCAQPLMARLGLPATVRASFACYSTDEDVAALEGAVRGAIEVLG